MMEYGDVALVVIAATLVSWTVLRFRDARRESRAADRQRILLVRG